ncbi:MAG: hypothetical protein LBL98_03910 [Ruminococcus sp.]|nr:hypothetical protein [Ruminococcus sp.]
MFKINTTDDINNATIEEEASASPQDDAPNLINDKRISHVTTSIQGLMTNSPAFLLASKIESEHIQQIIETDDKHNEREYKRKREISLLTALIIVIVLAFVLIFCIAFKDDTDTIKTVLVPLVTLIFGGSAGGIGGYGLGYKKGISSND